MGERASRSPAWTRDGLGRRRTPQAPRQKCQGGLGLLTLWGESRDRTAAELMLFNTPQPLTAGRTNR